MEKDILNFIRNNPGCDSVDLFGKFGESVIYPLQKLIEEGKVNRKYSGIRGYYEIAQ